MALDIYAMISAAASLLACALAGAAWLRLKASADQTERLERVLRDEAARGRDEAAQHARALREEVAGQGRGFQEAADRRHHELRLMVETKLAESRSDQATAAKALREEVAGTLRDRLDAVGRALTELGAKVEQRLDVIRGENAQKLEQMRQTVDEKLQGTLEKRLGESFKLVSDRLEQVHKGLGEMQTLANGVGDLKRVLTNVKARGTWGEMQLGTLLDQMLTPDQYLKDAVCRPGSQERVEFAIRLPGRGDGEPEVLLPVDAKFPNEDYERLLLAAERADADAVELASRQLETRVRQFAREIRDKYINPPHTTDFAILFLPTEGLYAEVLRRPGMVDQVQRDYKVTLAGPTTLCAMLNALQMGFRTLAIQQRSSEVWGILGAVKTEFGKYGQVLDKVQKKLQEASKTIDDVAVRKRAIDRSLRAVETLTDTQAESLLGIGSAIIEDMGAGDPMGEEEAAEA
jgi:DNA recombination protein RmuC